MNTPTTHKRTFKGVVTSDKMDKTIVVLVTSVRVHPKYLKQYHVSKKFKVHDEKEVAKVGDTVTFVETRPLSRDKRWALVSVTPKK